MLKFILVGFRFSNASIFSWNLYARKQRIEDESFEKERNKEQCAICK